MPSFKVSQSNVICGLGAYTHTVAATGPYFCKAQCSENPVSGLTITIAQSGSTTSTITSTAPTPAQTHVDVSKLFQCVAGDVITVTLASSTAIDGALNTVKTIVTLSQGQGQ